MSFLMHTLAVLSHVRPRFAYIMSRRRTSYRRGEARFIILRINIIYKVPLRDMCDAISRG